MTIEKICVQIKRAPDAGDLPLPQYHSEGAAGMDLCAANYDDVVLGPGEVTSIPCGFCIAVPPGFEGQVRSRSGIAASNGICVLNAPGTIDSDYRGEIKVLLVNHSRAGFIVTRGMRIAQLLILPVPRIEWLPVSELATTHRGERGFGHTGS